MSEETIMFICATALGTAILGGVVYFWENISSDLPEFDEDDASRPLSPNDIAENFEAILMNLKSIKINQENLEFLNILGIKKSIGDTITLGEIQKAYKNSSIDCHPDKKNGNNQKFNTLANAKEVLEGYFDTTTIDKAQEKLNQAKNIIHLDDNNRVIEKDIVRIKDELASQEQSLEEIKKRFQSLNAKK
ncbi:MAG: J domain-containing protein [Gammaproteobacteria bacterium]|nr:J domain-containing protein [Gammaproteobacteria bacterium]